MYFTGIGGARIHAKLVRPKNIKSPQPAVLQFHGYSGDCGNWHNKLSFAAQGYTVAALDCRGQGGFSEDTGGVKGWTLRGHIIRGLDNAMQGHPEKLLFRSIFLDTAQLAKIVMEMPQVDETRVGAIGGSQGGGLTLACASLVPEIKHVAPNFPFLTDYRRVWAMDLAAGAYEELKIFFRKFDPQHLREDEIFETLGYIDIQNLTKRIRGKVMMAVGLMDTTCPPSTHSPLTIKSSQKNLWKYILISVTKACPDMRIKSSSSCWIFNQNKRSIDYMSVVSFLTALLYFGGKFRRDRNLKCASNKYQFESDFFLKKLQPG